MIFRSKIALAALVQIYELVQVIPELHRKSFNLYYLSLIVYKIELGHSYNVYRTNRRHPYVFLNCCCDNKPLYMVSLFD